MRQITRSIEPERQYDDDRLVFMLGEELKKPLTAIKAIAESSDSPEAIQLEARRALRTIDNMLYFQALNQAQLQLDQTTVHVGATISDVANRLSPLSLERGCETEIMIQPGINTVYTDPLALRHGVESLWQAVLTMTGSPSPLTWCVYRTTKGVKIAIMNNSIDLSKVSLVKPRYMAGQSKQPFAGISGPATDLITAQGIFSILGSPLSKVRKSGLQGLAVTLVPSRQLAWL